MRKLKLLYSIGQSTTEYAVLLAIVATALIAMQVYVKRGIQGRIRDMADQISGTHYERQGTSSSYTTTQSGTLLQQYEGGVARTYQDGEDVDGDGVPDSAPERIERSGYEVVSPEEQ